MDVGSRGAERRPQEYLEGRGHVVVVIDCADLERSAAFWTAMLGYVRDGEPASPYQSLVPADGVGVELLLQRVPDGKETKNRLHLDLRTRDLVGEVARARSLGARPVDEQPIVEGGWTWHVLADPDGNEFCVIEPAPSYWDRPWQHPRVRRLAPSDWELLRRLRLEALQESPAAFGSTFEREVAFDEALWRSRLETSAYFVAETATEAIGMACAVRLVDPDSDSPPTMELVSMWVAPQHRRFGAGARLVAAVLDHARAEGEPLVGLWVAGGNEAAESFYRAAGFERRGEEENLPGVPDRCGVRMTIAL